MEQFDVLCRLTSDDAYYTEMRDKYREEDPVALSSLIVNGKLGFRDSTPVIVARPGWEGGCSPDISDWCRLKGIEVKDFNHPVEIDPLATNLSYAFLGCESFNQELSVPKSVKNREFMLQGCKLFNQPLKWFKDSNQCTGMLYGCESFNQKLIFPNHISGFGSVCRGCSSLNSIIRIPSDVPMEKVQEMFAGCSSLTIDKFILSEPTCYV